MPEHHFNTGITLVREDGQRIAGYYQYPPSSLETTFNTMANLGKFGVGALSLGITAAMPFCPPCAAAVTLLTVSEYLVRLIPGADVVANLIAMANPQKFLDCATRWGFGTLPDADDPEASDSDFFKGTGGSFGGGAAKLYKSTIVDDPNQLKRFEKWTQTGKSGAAMATFALGLYENKVWEAKFDDATASELRDTKEYEKCLSKTWKDPTT